MVTDMAYVYPRDLPKHIEDAWQSYPGIPEGSRQPLGLPLAPLLEPAYHASFLREEGGQVRFRIAYLTEAQAQTFAEPSFRSLPFITSRPCTADELRRLAPATDFTQSLVAVAPPSLASEEPLMIWGLISIGSALWNFSRRQIAGVTLPPDFLEVTSQSPGQIIFARQGKLLVMLQDGKRIYPRAVAGFPIPLGRLSQGCISQLQAELKWAVDIGWLSEAKLRDRISSRVGKYIDRLLLAIDDQRHGASLLLIPERLISCSKCRQSLRIKYELQRPSIDPLETLNEEIRISVRKSQRLSTAGDAELDNALTVSIQMIAAATRVDGAVALTDRLRLVGFGGEIVVPESSL